MVIPQKQAFSTDSDGELGTIPGPPETINASMNGADDIVDRLHVLVEVEEGYAVSSDARRISLLNYYLIVTGHEPRPTTELGFVPTTDELGLVKENEVSYSYSYTG
jgi:hypothetical protein